MRILGVPFNSSGHPDGVARAPQALRDAGLIRRLQSRRSGATPGVRSARSGSGPADWAHDAGDVSVGLPSPERDTHSGLKSLDSLETMTASLRQAVAEAVGHGDPPLVLGGDCPVLMGCLRGATDVAADVGLLFVDGHEDAWAPDRSTTGEAADCELGFLLGWHREGLPRSLVRLLPSLDPESVVALGPRDAEDLAEHRIPSLAERILMLSADELQTSPDAPMLYATEATDRIRRRTGNWWLHIDLDVLSTEALPAVDYPQPGGLTWPELELLTTTAMRAPGLLGMTLCIYNPDLDPGQHHAGRIVDFLDGLREHWPATSPTR